MWRKERFKSLNEKFLNMDFNLKGRIVKSLGSRISSKHAYLFYFFLGFLIRVIPELLSYPNLIGFDTVDYAARLKEGSLFDHWSNIFTRTWLLYSLMIPLQKILHLSPEIILKITSPILYGLNVAGIYYFANKTLKWQPKKCQLASLLFSFSITSLRISWDLYKNMLGLTMLLCTLSLMLEIKDLKRALGFTLLAIVIVLSHELTAASLLFIVIMFALREVRESNKAEGLRILASSLPALTIFLFGVYLRTYPIKYEVVTNIINMRDVNPEIFQPHPLGLPFLTNYLSSSSSVEHYDTFSELALHVVVLFALLYAIWLPLVIKGFFRDKILDVWTALLLAGSLGPLIVPFCSLLYWSRWMFMLVYPFTFYAVNGMEKFHIQSRPTWTKIGTIGIIIATILIGIVFMSSSTLAPFQPPLTYSYLPSNMQQNTIPLEDVEGTVRSIEWLNGKMNQNSVALVHHAFLSWAMLYLDKNHSIIYYAMNLTKAVELAKQNGFKEIYLIWWNQETGWYQNIKVQQNFTRDYTSGRISIYIHS